MDAYTTSPEGKTWTVTLRKGLAFSDGKPVTSADVIVSLTGWRSDTFYLTFLLTTRNISPVGSHSWKTILYSMPETWCCNPVSRSEMRSSPIKPTES
ncbi:ABC transporter substrate-binding protein [Paraburkholderia sp. RL18-103-BIB-C]